MQLTAWTTLAALAVYFWISLNVAKARMAYNVPAPAMDGPLPFMSVLRVQGNTVEQLVLFLPLLWMCAYFQGDRWAAAGGVVWIIGRVIYALGYYRDPGRRTLGFAVTMTGSATLAIGVSVGLLMR